MEQLLLPHLPDSHTLHIALYTNLQNAEFLHTQLLQGNTSFEYAFLDASVIISRTHLLSAAWRAINDQRAGRLKTRNVHSEIVFALSGNNNVCILVNVRKDAIECRCLDTDRTSDRRILPPPRPHTSNNLPLSDKGRSIRSAFQYFHPLIREYSRRPSALHRRETGWTSRRRADQEDLSHSAGCRQGCEWAGELEEGSGRWDCGEHGVEGILNRGQ